MFIDFYTTHQFSQNIKCQILGKWLQICQKLILNEYKIPKQTKLINYKACQYSPSMVTPSTFMFDKVEESLIFIGLKRGV